MRLRESASVGFGVAALTASIFILGGATRWGQALVAVLVAGSLVPFAWSRRSLQRPSPLIVVLAIAWLLTLIQLLPLPGGVLDVLQPVGNGYRDDGAALLGLSPWRAITLDA